MIKFLPMALAFLAALTSSIVFVLNGKYEESYVLFLGALIFFYLMISEIKRLTERKE